MSNLIQEKFEEWYGRYGTQAKKGRYFQALRDPHYVLRDRSTNPVPGYHQHIDITKYPSQSVYEAVLQNRARA